MNKFQEQKYLQIPNFFTKEECDSMYKEYKKSCEELQLQPCKISTNAYNAYQQHTHVCFMEKLCSMLPRVSEIVGESLLPTYALGRFYCHKAYLKRHLDRPACEISLTVNISQDKKWGIWLEPNGPNSEPVEIIQNPGDALFYHGCELRHWRTYYEGNEYCQAFFHYVRSRGKHAQHYFDRAHMSSNNNDKELKGV